MILPRQIGVVPETVGSESGTTPGMEPEARLDAVGIWFITFAAVWTVLLLGGMAFLYLKRNTPTIRLRGLWLTFASIVLLHLYWIVVQIVYTTGPLAPEVAEFWIMSIWLPFGIALFQAANSRFLHVAKAQSRFAGPPSQDKTGYNEKRLPQKTTWLRRLRQMDYTKRMFLFVTMGMVVQLIVVVIIFLVSRKFHPSFGIPGTEVMGSSRLEISMKQSRGWEWWPSIVWQFIWAWIVAPIILWRSRGIHDTHGWQRQTITCCIAGLPAAPMWLIGIYVSGMIPVNRYFVPPQWIALSIFVIEIFTIFVPCWEVRKHQNLRKETLESIANWESKKQQTGAKVEASSDPGKSSALPLSPTSTKAGEYTSFDSWRKLPSIEANTSQITLSGIPDKSVLTMSALELVLDKSPEPLRQFSARRDFSGENIAFLTAVAEWKAALPPNLLLYGSRDRDDCDKAGGPDDTVLREPFARALRIYTDFISPRDAEFPINIAWTDLRKVKGVFEQAANQLVSDVSSPIIDDITHFAYMDTTGSSTTTTNLPQAGPVTATASAPAVPTSISHPSNPAMDLEPQDKTQSQPTLSGSNSCHPPLLASYQGDIPRTFDASVFDAAQASIKYLVLTNTWPKYVREWRSSDPESSSSSGGGGSGSESESRSGNRSNKGGMSASTSSGSETSASTVGGWSLWRMASLKSVVGLLKGGCR
ncbi:hypothetical protein N658DRAFT_478922 [Parathielavia hyrcaniae]|uniref:RGS domain-containing protein n=1 Tax=Parathielavia hyrcaniae TaxID=113614 RepID=A0AAN6PT24_9PEZI|nr:hypothetical protein N658DRAFT_478922 [Parathielavia hyrcaniae]